MLRESISGADTVLQASPDCDAKLSAAERDVGCVVLPVEKE